MQRRFRLVVEYDGANYSGWQRQDNGPSVQQSIEEAVHRMTGQVVTVAGAGRTDAGVHALGQVASFSLEAPELGPTADDRLSPRRLHRGLNALLPPDIALGAVDEVPLDFDPRRHATHKLYRYRIWNAEGRSPLERGHSWHVRKPLDAAHMAEAAKALVGVHDFAAFRAADCERETTVRALTRLAVHREGPEDALVIVEAEGPAFLKNMVRILVGTLYEVGRGARLPSWTAEVLASRDRTRGGITAPPEGLYLVRVDYDLPLPHRR